MFKILKNLQKKLIFACHVKDQNQKDNLRFINDSLAALIV